MSLKKLGWSAFFEEQFQALKQPSWTPARVVNEERGFYRLETDQDSFWGELSGGFRFSTQRRLDLPAVGDFVACVPQSGIDRSIIHHLFERKTCIKRKLVSHDHEEQVLAANVDTVFITTSVNSDLNIRRIERYLTLIWNSGAAPVIVLTKTDVAEDLEESLTLVRSISQGVPIHPVSVVDGTGLDSLDCYFKNQGTVVLLGSSGVGKTSLVNYFLGYDALDTQDIRDWDEKGRHTTTSRDLLILPNGGMIIDTPGMKELGILDQSASVQELFGDIEKLMLQCKFSNCRHDTEPGCRIKEAVEKGTLEKSRLENYYKLQREAAYQQARLDKQAASLAKDKAKKISRSIRAKKGK